jgi:sugar phosphate isomerase/epimerase
MDRRRFLGAAAGALALAGFGPRRAPGLGFSLYGMKSLPLDDAFRACADAGYDHVELALLPGFPTDPAAFPAEARASAAARLKALGLGLPCLMDNLSLAAPDPLPALRRIADAAGLARDLVPDRPPILETILGGKPEAWEAQKDTMLGRLRGWAEAAEREKTVIAVKAHVMSAVTTPERLLWLLDRVESPAIQVAYDYSHFEVQGLGLEETLLKLLPRTRFIHVKDSAGDASSVRFLLPGDGRTDYVAYFSLLKRHGYEGPVCVEVSGQIFNRPGYDPVAAARRCFAALSAARAKAGT